MRDHSEPRDLRERDIEAYLVARVKARGGECRKVEWIGRRGAPDRLVMLPFVPGLQGLRGMGSAIWVELKAPGVKAEAYQLREHVRMREKGQRVEVIDSLLGVEELLS